MNGKRLSAIAESWGMSPEDAFLRIIIDAHQDIEAALFCLNESPYSVFADTLFGIAQKGLK